MSHCRPTLLSKSPEARKYCGELCTRRFSTKPVDTTDLKSSSTKSLRCMPLNVTGRCLSGQSSKLKAPYLLSQSEAMQSIQLPRSARTAAQSLEKVRASPSALTTSAKRSWPRAERKFSWN